MARYTWADMVLNQVEAEPGVAKSVVARSGASEYRTGVTIAKLVRRGELREEKSQPHISAKLFRTKPRKAFAKEHNLTVDQFDRKEHAFIGEDAAANEALYLLWR